jgi:hypothetical protein
MSSFRNSIGVLALFVLSDTTFGEELDEAKARASLALAKAKREREATSCFRDYEVAATEARRTNRPLVLWVGLTCREHATLRRELADAVHCHVAKQRGDDSPRVVIQGVDGIEWFIRPEKIGSDTAKKIREKWDAPKVPPLRTDVGVIEELDCAGGRCPARPR